MLAPKASTLHQKPIEFRIELHTFYWIGAAALYRILKIAPVGKGQKLHYSSSIVCYWPVGVSPKFSFHLSGRVYFVPVIEGSFYAGGTPRAQLVSIREMLVFFVKDEQLTAVIEEIEKEQEEAKAKSSAEEAS